MVAILALPQVEEGFRRTSKNMGKIWEKYGVGFLPRLRHP
jgi:hypothetical protein